MYSDSIVKRNNCQLQNAGVRTIRTKKDDAPYSYLSDISSQNITSCWCSADSSFGWIFKWCFGSATTATDNVTIAGKPIDPWTTCTTAWSCEESVGKKCQKRKSSSTEGARRKSSSSIGVLLRQATENVPANNVLEQPLLPLHVPLLPLQSVKRCGNVSKYHGCTASFDKTNINLHVLCRKEEDWWPKVDKCLTKCGVWENVHIIIVSGLRYINLLFWNEWTHVFPIFQLLTLICLHFYW